MCAKTKVTLYTVSGIAVAITVDNYDLNTIKNGVSDGSLITVDNLAINGRNVTHLTWEKSSREVMK